MGGACRLDLLVVLVVNLIQLLLLPRVGGASALAVQRLRNQLLGLGDGLALRLVPVVLAERIGIVFERVEVFRLRLLRAARRGGWLLLLPRELLVVEPLAFGAQLRELGALGFGFRLGPILLAGELVNLGLDDAGTIRHRLARFAVALGEFLSCRRHRRVSSGCALDGGRARPFVRRGLRRRRRLRRRRGGRLWLGRQTAARCDGKVDAVPGCAGGVVVYGLLTHACPSSRHAPGQKTKASRRWSTA